MLKNVLLTIFILSYTLSLFAQKKDSTINYKLNNLLISLSYNQNFTFSNGRAINFWAFYDYKEQEYWHFDQYYPLLEYLNADSSEWQIEPSLALNINYFHFIGNSNLGIGIITAITKVSLSSIATSQVNGATARLYVKGHELRTVFSPALGYKFRDLYTYVNLNIKAGFKKDYKTYLKITEYNSQTTMFHNNHDLFKKNDFTLGVGFGFLYKINTNFGLGLNYNNHKVNISDYRSGGLGPLITFPNAYWNHSISFSLGYYL